MGSSISLSSDGSILAVGSRLNNNNVRVFRNDLCKLKPDAMYYDINDEIIKSK